MMRSLEYVYPRMGYANVKDEFLMGDDLLVAPVVEKGAASRKVLIPPGKWLADDGKAFDGPAEITVETPLSRLPHFSKVPCGPCSAAANWTPPAAWRHPVIAGRDFHYVGRSLAPGGKYSPPKTNSFDGMSCEYRVLPHRNSDGRWVHDLSQVEPLKADDGSTRPFTLNYFPRITCRPNVFLTGKLNQQSDLYAEFKAREPSFFGFVTLEWVNDAINPRMSGENLVCLTLRPCGL